MTIGKLVTNVWAYYFWLRRLGLLETLKVTVGPIGPLWRADLTDDEIIAVLKNKKCNDK